MRESLQPPSHLWIWFLRSQLFVNLVPTVSCVIHYRVQEAAQATEKFQLLIVAIVCFKVETGKVDSRGVVAAAPS